MKHRGDVYATHGLGPVAQALNIHRGDRMKTLIAMDTKSVIGKDLVEKEQGKRVTTSAMVTIRLHLFVQKTGKLLKYNTM